MNNNSEIENDTQTNVRNTVSDFIGSQLYLLGTVLVTAIAGFLYGYDTGIISGALMNIAHDFKLDAHQQEIITSILLFGAVIGSLVCGRLSAFVGRRHMIMIVTAIFGFSVIAAGYAPTAFWLGAARLVLGFAVGGSSQIVPVYIAELAPADQRGRMVTFYNISIGLGILAAGIVGAFLQEEWTWRTMFSVAAIPAAVLFCSMMMLPESPRWLVRQERVEEARDMLDTVRETDHEVTKELRSIKKISNRTKEAAQDGWKALAQPWVRPALIAGLGVAAFTQLSGIEMMIYYTPTFLRDSGFTEKMAYYSALGVALIYVIMTTIGKLLVDHVGRRKLALCMMPLAALSLFALGIAFNLPGGASEHRWLILACLFAFMVFNAGGIQVIGWLIGSEVYPLCIRARATSLHAATLWGSNLILTSTALTMTSLLGIGGSMWFYGGLNALGFVFVYFMVPETKGRSLEEIESSLKDGSFLPSKKASA
ncbi:sugar transporter [Zymomonas mobilis subsp. mobilis ZM4 = ATCC 31821]|uniref:Sugar transporter n=2 Tax=Zymomonas mobilis subsp. mobilis TaxID=120045 RepID=Q5NQT7_ZYMMO|nr:sugar porter family MFS transporter [Zymomonas mobilis]AAV88917.1 sugar transporter [Zymomonas mobilis subsp. mobilis ZM4 = ATCC 31821]ACV75478.1 sugar transporter [Zymomonas mobilis subsp. mobilis NCIMB 11163]AEH62684.1 sugar transporter [Zymomonas mobilis subsp. mobilis ATCC 10988]AFN56833.1 sugar transporter [Zymomonas mobilis subsp. mobilis ATCC 29191]AHB10264.1 MFS transporter, sugar porter family [Zymomonas mobilis subsp. mobilis str. CP4 = NRRL B-14023]